MGRSEDSVQPLSRAEWRAWLEANHARGAGVWLITYKKATGRARVEYGEAVEEALCFGWVDSTAGKVDEERSKLWFAPRKVGSGWSAPNKERVARMMAEGRMAAAGLAKVEAAKADGSWAKLDGVEALEVPEDLRKALQGVAGARGNWEGFPRSAKRGILEWILNAKRAETRARRVAETARLAGEGKRANEWKG